MLKKIVVIVLLLNFTAVLSFAAAPCFITKWDGSLGGGVFNGPYGIAVDNSGNVYVADQGNDQIKRYGTSGNYISGWGGLNTPFGVACDTLGFVYVVDSDNDRVKKFSAAGTYISDVGSGSGAGNGQFHAPTSIALDSLGNIYVVELGNSRVQKFDSSGNYILQWGSNGTGDGQFLNPYGIACDSTGNVYVADAANQRVQKFDSSGNYILQWGGFSNPFGVAVDSAGLVYVADAGNRNVQVFDQAGIYQYDWGTMGIGDGQFLFPVAIAFDNAGNIYVTDSSLSANRVQKFGVCTTHTNTPTCTQTNTVTQTQTEVFTQTVTETDTPTLTVTASNTATMWHTQTVTQTAFFSETCTTTNTITPQLTHTTTPILATTTATTTATVTVTATVTPTNAIEAAELTIEKSVTGDQPETGANVTFSINVSNTTLQSVTNLIVWDTLPSQLDYNGYAAAIAPQVTGNYVVFTIPVLNPGQIARVEIMATVRTFISGYPIQNTAWCDYNDAFYTAPSKHPAISSNSVFYPVDEPCVYPNPFNPDTAIDNALKIRNMVPGSRLNIYTLSAELVYAVDAVTTFVNWNAKNRYGNRVSPGIYYYVIQTPDKHIYKGKLFIVH
ncbi:MAG: hypothetical protein CVV21_04745 [Candidatus Goldiibacteriota bacterium HGW-Goldbacteria-1]|jgi:uncharacterized repeat protein (TIGR01451 family)|nr:MAG: hypothetical protein CVV21_04745 [Candidatus Goldiibacteriota bacterium HGW-Goldbacteria-1]